MSKKGRKGFFSTPAVVNTTPAKPKYLPNHCPICDAYKYTADSVDLSKTGNTVTKSFTCDKCASTWDENYTLSASNFKMGSFKDLREPYIEDTTPMSEVTLLSSTITTKIKKNKKSK